MESKILEQGINNIYERKYKNAISVFREICNNDKNHTDAFAWLSISLVMINEFDEAEHIITQLFDSQDSNNSSLILLAKGLLLLNRDKSYLDSIINLDKSLSLDSKNAYTWAVRGYGKACLEDIQGANQDLTKAIEIYPQFPSALVKLGRILITMESYKDAVKKFDQALEIDPDYGFAWYNNAIAKWNMDDIQGALSCFDNYLEIEPDDDNGYYQRARLKYFKLNNPSKAINDISHAIKIKEDYRYYEFQGLIYKKMGEPEKYYRNVTKANQLGLDILEHLPSKNFPLGYDLGKAAYKHMKEVTLPQIKQTDESFIEYFLCSLTWLNNIIGGVYGSTSYYSHYGLGYLCFSTTELRIVVLGDISKKYKRKNRFRSQYSSKINIEGERYPDGSDVEISDRTWRLSNNDIQSVLFADNDIRLKAASESWTLESIYNNVNSDLSLMLNMARDGKLAKLLGDEITPVHQSEEEGDIFNKIEKLADMKAKGYITLSEFEKKKKELISRL